MAKGSSLKPIHTLGIVSLLILVGAIFFSTMIVQQETRTESEAAGASQRANLFAAPSEVGVGEEAYALWVNKNVSEGDWVGLYVQGAANTTPLEKKLLSECESGSRKAKQKIGVCTFTLPIITGVYEFRMFNVKDSKKEKPMITPKNAKRPTGTDANPLPKERHIGTSGPITVTNAITAEPSVSPTLPTDVLPE